MGQCGGRALVAAQHAGNLTDPVFPGDWADLAADLALGCAFAHHPVVICKGCHLGQMGDGQHLAVLAELLHQTPDRIGHSAAHTRIDFVKNQGARLAQFTGGHRNGQCNARQLAARGHLAHGARGAARMPGDQKNHLFQAVLAQGFQALQLHLKAPAWHAQLLHGAADRHGQWRGRLLALLRDGFGRLGTEPMRGLLGLLQAFQVGCGIELCHGLVPTVQRLWQLVGQFFEPARQGQPQAHAFVELGQVRRVQIGFAQITVQAVGHVLGLRLGRTQHLGPSLKLGLKPGQRLQGVNGFGQRAQCTTAIPAFQQFSDLLTAIDQGLRIGQSAVLVVQFLPFAGQGLELFQLANLPSQPFALLAQGALGLLGIGQGLLGCAPAVPSGFECAGVNARIGIEQAAHSLWPGQALPSVLAMNVQQLLAQLAQLCGRGRAAIDPSAAFATGVYRAAQQQWGGGLKPSRLQPNLNGRRGFKFGAHFAARGPLAHQCGLGAGTQGQLQGIDQDGFAGPGFSGQHAKAGAQVQSQFVHDDKIAQADVRQCHGLSPLVPVHFFAQGVKVVPASRV